MRLWAFALLCALPLGAAPVIVTLAPSASPSVAQPGVQRISVAGSGFPAGVIQPADVTIHLTAPAGSGEPNASVQSSAVQTLFAGTVRVSFALPFAVHAPTSYSISLNGHTSGANRTLFQSGNRASMTVNPAPEVLSVSPAVGNAGVSVQVTITGRYTNFLGGATQASFGPGVSVGGAPSGEAGPVMVTGAGTAVAQLLIDVGASAGLQTVTVMTGLQQAALTNGFQVAGPVALVNIDMAQTREIAQGISGFDDEHLITGVEYFDPKFLAAVTPLKPGFIRFPAGTPSMAYDWQAGHENQSWINSISPKVSQFAQSAMVLGQKLTQSTGGFYLADFANFVNALGVPAIICFNGFTDTNPDSAGRMVLAAQADNLKVQEWELSNEPFFYPLLFSDASAYLTAMDNPYFIDITDADSNATVGVFLEGQFDLPNSNYQAWDNGVASYSPHYWNAVSTHIYPILNKNISTLNEEQTLNGFLAHGTTEYFNSYLLPLVGPNTPVYISEINDDPFGTMPFEAYMFNGVFLAEYVARMSTIPNVKAVGVVALYLGNNFQLGMIRAVNDFQNYLIGNVNKNPNFSTNTASDPNTQFSFYYSAPGLAMEVANLAINNSTHIWPTTVAASPTVPIQGYDGNPVAALFAQGYMGDNGTHYLLITNKSGASVPIAIEVSGNLLSVPLTVSSVSNASDTAQNTASQQNAVQIVNTTSANPLTVGPYSVTRVEW